MESPFQMNNSFILKKVASGYCVKKIMKPFICWWLGTLIYNELCMLTAQSNTENCKIQCSIICWGPGLNCRCLWYPSLVLIQKGCVWWLNYYLFGDSIVFETEKIHKPMNFNVVIALIYMLADNQYLLLSIYYNSLAL